MSIDKDETIAAAYEPTAYERTGLSKVKRRKRRRARPSEPTPQKNPENDPETDPAVSPDEQPSISPTPPTPFRPDRASCFGKIRPDDLIALSAAEIAAHYGLGPWDTGNKPVQIALMTRKVLARTEHLSEHKKDLASRRGLQQTLGRRRSMLNSLQAEDVELYRHVIRSLPGLQRLDRGQPRRI